jgi:hypothetical protein
LPSRLRHQPGQHLRLHQRDLQLRPLRQPDQRNRRPGQQQPARLHRRAHRPHRHLHQLPPPRRPLVRSRHRRLHHPGHQRLPHQPRQRQPLRLRRRQPRQQHRPHRPVFVLELAVRPWNPRDRYRCERAGSGCHDCGAGVQPIHLCPGCRWSRSGIRWGCPTRTRPWTLLISPLSADGCQRN